MFMNRIVALSLLAASTTAMADSVDFTFRDTSAQFQYRASMGRDALGKSEFHIGALYVDKDDMLSDIGIFVKDELGGNAPGFSVGVGVKAVVGKARGRQSCK